MRVLMKYSLPNTAGNRPRDPEMIRSRIEDLHKRVHPEASYFYPEHGHRTGLMIFDLKDPSDMPALSMALLEVEATVEVFPVMNLEDLKRGLAKAAEQRAAGVR